MAECNQENDTDANLNLLDGISMSQEYRDFQFNSSQDISEIFDTIHQSFNQPNAPLTQVVSRRTDFDYANKDDEEEDLFEITGETLTVRQMGGPLEPMWGGEGAMTLSREFSDGESTYQGQQTEQNTSSNGNIEVMEINHAMADSTPSSAIPSNKAWPGTFNFSLVFQEQPVKVTKSTSWTYSETLEKLYINMGYSCIVCFKVDKMPPPGCVIRALPIFEKAEHLREIVRRCPTHCLPTDISNVGHADPEHLVRCDSDLAQYQTDPYSARQSVVVPFQAPQAGTDNSEYLYKFMCFGSCVGGLNRRPIMLIFTLEKDGQVLGRRPLRVRICACPGRDRRNDEKHLESRHQKPYATGSASTSSRVVNQTTTTEIISMVPPPRKRSKIDDDVYTLTVKGRANYEILSKIKQALELADMVPPSTVQAYRTEQAQMSRTNSAISNLPSCSQALRDIEPIEQPKSVIVPMTSGSQETAQPTVITLPLRRLQSAGKQHPANSSRAGTSSDKQTNASINLLQVKREAPDLIDCWLEGIGMGAYADVFLKHNLTEMAQLENLAEDDLAKLNIGEAHRQKIWNALLEYYGYIGDGLPLSQTSTFSQNSTSGRPTCYQISRYQFKRVKSMKLSDQ